MLFNITKNLLKLFLISIKYILFCHLPTNFRIKTSNNQLIILTIKDKEVIYKTEKAIKKAIILTIKNKEVIYKTEKEVKKITVIKSTPEQIVYKDRNQIKIASLNKKNNYSYNPNNNIQSINSRIINSKSTDNQKRKIRKK